ncbi:zinc finger protein 652-B-like [Manihot esculenta]|nr:zinc finger protein 652-B-like [Manihot esculenta]
MRTTKTTKTMMTDEGGEDDEDDEVQVLQSSRGPPVQSADDDEDDDEDDDGEGGDDDDDGEGGDDDDDDDDDKEENNDEDEDGEEEVIYVQIYIIFCIYFISLIWDWVAFSVGAGDMGPTSSSGVSNMQDLRCYSASYASSVYPTQSQAQTQVGNNDVRFKKGKSASGSVSKSWSFNDPELQRKKRVASYKVYSVEGKVKGSFRKSFRWLKDR